MLSTKEEEKPLYLFRKSLPQLPINCVGEKPCFLSLPFPIFDLVHVQVILAAVYPYSFYPVITLPIKRTAVTEQPITR